MANLLSGAASIAAQSATAAVFGQGAASSAYAATSAITAISNTNGNAAIATGIQAGMSLLSGSSLNTAVSGALTSLTGVSFGSIFGTGGGLSGQKPSALHTERAAGDFSHSQPYGEVKDIEFFLLRADQTAPATVEQAADAAASAAGAVTGAATNTGSSFLGGALQTPLGQLAGGLAMSAAVGAVSQALPQSSLTGPLTALGASAAGNLLSGKPLFPGLSGTAAAASAPTVTTGSDAVTYQQNLATAAFNPGAYGFSQSTQDVSALYSASSTSLTSGIDSSVFTSGATASLTGDLATSYGSITSTESMTAALASGDALTSTSAAFSIDSGALSGVASALTGSPAAEIAASDIQNKDTLADIPKSWYFVTAPQDVNWSKEGAVSTIDTYGTNTPYVLYGSTSLRKLSLGNTMVEGFSDGKQVEGNITALETCMNMVIQKGYTAPFCWKLYVGGKCYGTFVIASVKVKEAMRDMSGKATRAFVDIELQEVPAYQVNSGRDLAAKGAVGGKAAATAKTASTQDASAASAKTK